MKSIYPEEVSERLLAQIWQNRLGKRKLVTTMGQVLGVAYPGAISRGGPDFRGAILELAGERMVGDVEVHVRSSLWRAHGHFRDPLFNNVILHPVFWHDGPETRLENGKEIPLLVLSVLAWDEVMSLAKPVTCGEVSGEVLDRWGEGRFMAKAEIFRGRLLEDEADQVLYEGMMEALGYSQNGKPMRELARRVPFSHLKGWLSLPDGEKRLKRIFMAKGEGLPWRLAGIRPVNHPFHRLEAVLHLLRHYGDPSLVAGMRGILAEIKKLEAGLMVPGVLGRDRAAEVAVNIILPFFSALGVKKAKELFDHYPNLGENEVTRHMRAKLLVRGEVNSARRQQGLIHLYKVFCQQGRCFSCEVPKGV